MTARPTVSVVMPFAGDGAAARAAAGVLSGLRVHSDDELILADNSGTAAYAPPGVEIIRALGERSPAHARNVGATGARGDWILFLDADCRPPASLVDDFLAEPVGPEVGALAGAILPAAPGATVAERYGAARNFLDVGPHLAHPYLPRATAANLLVRAETFRGLAGFQEGLRAAEDTDFCWRLQRAGWRLEFREQAAVEHAYRTTIVELRRQWRQYAAGRAWLARRYPDFHPQPALVQAIRGRGRRSALRSSARTTTSRSPRDRVLFGALDLLLAVEELRGLRELNLPEGVET